MACAREHGQADGVVGGDREGQVRLGAQSPLQTPLQDAGGGELLPRCQEHGALQAQPLESGSRPPAVESGHQLALQQLKRGLPTGGGGTFAHLSGLLGPGGRNIVGGQQHAGVRKVEYCRQGQGVAYFEPLHIQWLPCRREYMDLVEVEIAESHGGLIKLSTGRTLITFVFIRDI